MKTIQLKIHKNFLKKIEDGQKWIEIRKKDLNIKKGDIIEFIEPDEGFKVGEVILKTNVSILDKEYFFSLSLRDDYFDNTIYGYGLEDDSEFEWLRKYLKDTDKVYLYELKLSTFKSFSYNRFVYLLNIHNGDYFENKAVFSKLLKAQRALKAWKKAEPDALFKIDRLELNNRNFNEDAIKCVYDVLVSS